MMIAAVSKNTPARLSLSATVHNGGTSAVHAAVAGQDPAEAARFGDAKRRASDRRFDAPSAGPRSGVGTVASGEVPPDPSSRIAADGIANSEKANDILKSSAPVMGLNNLTMSATAEIRGLAAATLHAANRQVIDDYLRPSSRNGRKIKIGELQAQIGAPGSVEQAWNKVTLGFFQSDETRARKDYAADVDAVAERDGLGSDDGLFTLLVDHLVGIG